VAIADIVVGVGSTSPVNPRELRVSDAERQHVVDLLNRAVGQGMLSLDDFTERTDAALRAQTRGELNGVLIDLPGLTVVGSAVAGGAAETLELRQTASSLRRQGLWTVPPRLVLRNRLGSMVLDFSQAHITHREVVIDIENDLGSIIMIVPDGSTVNADQLSVTMSSFSNTARAGVQPGYRHFVLTGRLMSSSLKVRPHRQYQFGPFVVHRPFRITRAR
jgi:hypothetical protein